MVWKGWSRLWEDLNTAEHYLVSNEATKFLRSIPALAGCTSTLERIDSGGANVIQECIFNAGVCIHRVCIGKLCETSAANC